MMFWVLLLLVGLQGCMMFFDEFYYHHKRGLPAWERLGHPIDTFSFLICFLFLKQFEPNESHLLTYIFLSMFSSFLVLKDEWVHAALCEKEEMMLHSFLFVLHPLILFFAGYNWWFATESFGYWSLFLNGQIGFVILFMIYQIGFWCFFKLPRRESI